MTSFRPVAKMILSLDQKGTTRSMARVVLICWMVVAETMCCMEGRVMMCICLARGMGKM